MTTSNSKNPIFPENSEVLARAVGKIRDGKRHELSKRESQALKRYDADREENLRQKHYVSIPQKHWKQMSGRQTKVLKEQEERYGIPFGGPVVNLPEVVRAIHDFLAANKYKLAEDDPMVGVSGPWAEEYRKEPTLLARLERLEREGSLIPRDKTRIALLKFASILRDAGDVIQQQFGAGAAEILHDALDECDALVERSFSEPDSGVDADDSSE